MSDTDAIDVIIEGTTAVAPTHYPDDTAAFIARCEAECMTVVYPAANELQIDIDSLAQAFTFDDIWPIFCAEFQAIISDRRPSKSGPPKEHITVTLPYNVTEVERIALQAILGSDGRRELFGYRRIRNGVAPVSILVRASLA